MSKVMCTYTEIPDSLKLPVLPYIQGFTGSQIIMLTVFPQNIYPQRQHKLPRPQTRCKATVQTHCMLCWCLTIASYDTCFKPVRAWNRSVLNKYCKTSSTFLSITTAQVTQVCHMKDAAFILSVLVTCIDGPYKGVWGLDFNDVRDRSDIEFGSYSRKKVLETATRVR